MLLDVHLCGFNGNRQAVDQVTGSHDACRCSVVSDFHAMVLQGRSCRIDRDAVAIYGDGFPVDSQRGAVITIGHVTTVRSVEAVSDARHFHVKRLGCCADSEERNK